MKNYLRILGNSIFFSIIAMVPLILMAVILSQLGIIEKNSSFSFSVFGTLMVAFIAIPLNFELQRKKMVASQVVKARVDWLKSMKEYTANYLNSVDNYINSQNSLSGYKYCKNRDKDEKTSQELKNIADKNYYLLIFNLNPDEKITKKIKKYHFMFVAGTCNCNECYPQKRTKIAASIQKYFKREWDKSKEEIKSGDIAAKDNK